MKSAETQLMQQCAKTTVLEGSQPNIGQEISQGSRWLKRLILLLFFSPVWFQGQCAQPTLLRGAEMASATLDSMRPQRLCVLAQHIAEGTPDFFQAKGPGKGDQATAAFVRTLQAAARDIFGVDLSEKPACNSAGFRLDFYFPEEAVAVEFAFGLHNPNSEFERDIFKCLLAIEDGCALKRLMLVGKPGAIARLCAPAPKAIIAFVKRRFELTVEILELQQRV